MKVSELEIRSRDSVETLVVLSSENGHLRVMYVDPELRPAVARWLRDGLVEWVEGPKGSQPRRTPATHRDFLRRLRDYLRTQSGFSFNLEETTIVGRDNSAPLPYVFEDPHDSTRADGSNVTVPSPATLEGCIGDQAQTRGSAFAAAVDQLRNT